MLDSRTIDIVKSTVPLLESANTALTEHFYRRMFRDNPELKDV
ncbi:MAG: NO-inducible flavohemoprotein, partial [Oceanisphaera sp.]|nr:NO-inducible flavohemoprotein [Oceanisphaera sp.]